MTLTATQKNSVTESLRQCRANISSVRDQLKHARDLNAAAQQAAIEGKGDRATVLSAGKEEARLRMDLEQLKDEESTYLALMGQHGTNGNGSGAVESYLDDPDIRRRLALIASASQASGERVVFSHFSPEVVASWTGRMLAESPTQQAAPTPQSAPTPSMQLGPWRGIVPLLMPAPTFLDLVPTETTEYPSNPFSPETPTTGTGPGVAAPGSVKPQLDTEYIDATANTETIAGWIRTNRQTLADVPSLQNRQLNTLQRKLMRALETEVLTGTGAVSDVAGQPGIVGLLNTSGTAALAPTAGVKANPDVLDNAVTAVEVTGATVNVIVMNPLDRSDLRQGKSSGSGEYYLPIVGQSPSPWGIPIVTAVGLPKGKIIVGDTSGLSLLVREGVNVRISDSDTDAFSRNQVVLLAEGRWAFAVYQPAAFCVVTLS